MSTLADVIQSGLFASRPAAGTAGRIYFATDTAQTYRDNGATWDDVSDSGTGALAAANNLSDLPNAGTARTNLGLGTAATKNTGTTAGTVAAGDDSRITGALQASSNLSDLASAGTARGNLGLGTAAVLNVPASGDAASGEVVKGSDTRLTDSRTPAGHHTSHNTGGSDPIAPADIGAAAASHTHTASAVTDFSEAVDDRVAALLVAGTNVTLTYNDGANTLTVDVTGGGGGGSALTVDEVDGTPSDAATTRITFPNGSLTDSSGHVTYSPLLATTSAQGEVVLATPSSDTTAGHVVQASDTRLSDSRTPTGSAGGDLSGTYPNPALALITAGYVDVTEISPPSNPASGKLRLYAKTDHTLHTLTNGGTDTALGAGGGGGSTIYTSAYASAPGSPANGDWWYPSDGGGIYAARISSAWVWFYKGFPITLPATSGWSWNNQRSSTVATSTGTIYLHAPADSTDSWSMYLRTLPSTPYSLVAYVEPILVQVNYAGGGVALRTASTGDWIAFVQYANSASWRHLIATGSSGNGISAATFELNAAQKIWNWLKVTDDGTTRKYYYGDDGQNWELLYSHGHTAITTPDTYGLALESRSGAPVGLRLVSLTEYNSVI